MNASFLRSFICLVVVAWFAGLSRAQPEKAPAVQVRLLAWETPVGGLYHRVEGRDYVAADVPAYRMGAAIMVSEGGTLVLSRKNTVEGKDTYTPVLRIPLPAGAARVRVAVVPASVPDAETPYQAIIVPDDAKHFAPGQILAINMTPLPAVAHIAGVNHPLAAFEAKVLTPPVSPQLRVVIKSGVAMQNEWKIIGSDVIGLPAGYRAMLIITISETIGYEEGKDAARPIAFTSTEWLSPSSR